MQLHILQGPDGLQQVTLLVDCSVVQTPGRCVCVCHQIQLHNLLWVHLLSATSCHDVLDVVMWRSSFVLPLFLGSEWVCQGSLRLACAPQSQMWVSGSTHAPREPSIAGSSCSVAESVDWVISELDDSSINAQNQPALR